MAPIKAFKLLEFNTVCSSLSSFSGEEGEVGEAGAEEEGSGETIEVRAGMRGLCGSSSSLPLPLLANFFSSLPPSLFANFFSSLPFLLLHSAIDTVVLELMSNPARKFIYVEMAYFFRYSPSLLFFLFLLLTPPSYSFFLFLLFLFSFAKY